jgi:hypothetical protein
MFGDKREQEGVPEDARGRASTEQHRRYGRRPSHIAIHPRFDRSAAGQAAPQEGGRPRHVGLPGDDRGSDRQPDRGHLRMHRSVRVRSERDADIIGNDGVHPAGLLPEFVDSLRFSPHEGRDPPRCCSLDASGDFRDKLASRRSGDLSTPEIAASRRCLSHRRPAPPRRQALPLSSAETRARS